MSNGRGRAANGAAHRFYHVRTNVVGSMFGLNNHIIANIGFVSGVCSVETGPIQVGGINKLSASKNAFGYISSHENTVLSCKRYSALKLLAPALVQIAGWQTLQTICVFMVVAWRLWL